MKNIHVLPTDKPSRLYLNGFQRLVLDDKIEIADDNSFTNQHIYITNSEEIKDAKWIIHNGKIHEVTKNKGLYISVKEVIHIDIRANLCKKIILTTDPDLIKDGVQVIDDEFLEWFVKNPSCEEVEVENIPNNNWGFDLEEPMNLGYKIIIPKEELKQETLEEDLLNIAIQLVGDNNITTIKEFLVKHKWQAERMYSEEDLKEAFEAGHKKGFSGYPNTENWKELPFEKWFEQFKKK